VQIGIPKETTPRESRVAAVVETVRKLVAQGAEVVVEAGAGVLSTLADDDYRAAGAKIGTAELAFKSDIVLKVAPPTDDEIEKFKEGSLLISFLDPLGRGKQILPKLALRKMSAIALELIPRITRAQYVDALSSQANLAGYKAVLEGVNRFKKIIPMMTTSAGTIPPAQVLVLGAGVAGLQAIATAKRLGARVEAFDVRPEVKEQIESLGARFIEIPLEESGAGSGGYAKELSERAKEMQQQLLTERVKKADLIITTALIPGRPAPKLITADAVRGMRRGSIIVDMAAAAGGNCELSKADGVVEIEGVTIIGYTDLPSRIADHASQLYAKNMLNYLSFILTKETSLGIRFDLGDEIVSKSLVLHQGELRGKV